MILKQRKLFFLITGAVFLFGALLALIGLVSGAKADYDSKLKFCEFEANVPASNVYNLQIDSSMSDITVISSNDVDKINIVGHNISKEFLDYTTSNNTFRLKYATKKWYQVIYKPAYNSADGSIEIYVPAKLPLKDVEIKCTNGNTRINYLTADRTFIYCGGEESSIKDMNCSYSKLTTSGDYFNGVNISAEAADLKVNKGEAVISNFTSSSLSIINNSGKLDLSGVVSGDSAITSDGDSVFTLYGDSADYNFSVTGGDVTVNGREPKENSSAKYDIKLQGDMDITIE